jgi:drug/metabolite transporter (DMT)-like permease
MAAARYMTLAMMIIALVDNLVVIIAEHTSLWQFFILRTAMMIPLIAIGSFMGLGSMKAKSLWRVSLRGGLLALGMLFYFGALGFVSLAQALAGLFTAPIFVLLITAFLLKKRIGPRRILAVSIGFVGILLVIGPNFNELGWPIVMPVLGGFFYACGSIATRELCDGEENFSMLTATFVIQAIIGVIGIAVVSMMNVQAPEGATGYLLRGIVWPLSDAFPYIVASAIGSVVGVSYLIRSYQVADASLVTVYEYSIFMFGPLFAWLIWGQTIGPIEGGGIVLIAIAGTIIAFRSDKA